MLRGFAQVNYFADDVAAAKHWYTEVFGSQPYFERSAGGRLAYVEFRVGDYQHEVGIIDSRFAPHDVIGSPAGVVLNWHVDDLAATLDRLVELGAKEHDRITERGAGFVTASVVDPFGNVLGIMTNPHYREILAAGAR
jgi:predicted enzyme related to lactoylglutathione lyase